MNWFVVNLCTNTFQLGVERITRTCWNTNTHTRLATTLSFCFYAFFNCLHFSTFFCINSILQYFAFCWIDNTALRSQHIYHLSLAHYAIFLDFHFCFLLWHIFCAHYINTLADRLIFPHPNSFTLTNCMLQPNNINW